jgi:hypothetical protein
MRRGAADTQSGRCCEAAPGRVNPDPAGGAGSSGAHHRDGDTGSVHPGRHKRDGLHNSPVCMRTAHMSDAASQRYHSTSRPHLLVIEAGHLARLEMENFDEEDHPCRCCCLDRWRERSRFRAGRAARHGEPCLWSRVVRRAPCQELTSRERMHRGRGYPRPLCCSDATPDAALRARTVVISTLLAEHRRKSRSYFELTEVAGQIRTAR